jgi:Cu(I)/Ag(I) efflux system protein CusF
MPAMTMTFPVQDTAHLRMLKPGDQVQIQAADVGGTVKVVNVRMQH